MFRSLIVYLLLSKLKEPCLKEPCHLCLYPSYLMAPVILTPFLITLDGELPEVHAVYKIQNCHEFKVAARYSSFFYGLGLFLFGFFFSFSMLLAY